MAFPVNDPELSQLESIDAIADAKAGILQCLSDFFYEPKGDSYYYHSFVPTNGCLVQTISNLDDLEDKTEFMKNALCALACEELSAAKLIEALSCKLAVNKGLLADEDCCKCCCCENK